MELLRKLWQRVSGENKTTGIVYIIYGAPHIYRHIFDSISQVRNVTDLPISIICDSQAAEIISSRDQSINLICKIGHDNDIDRRPGKYRKCFKPKLNGLSHLPYDTNIVIDCDCFFNKSFECLLSNDYDIGYCKEANYVYRHYTRSWDHSPYLWSLNSGFIVIKKNKEWFKLYDTAVKIYNDYELGICTIPWWSDLRQLTDQWALGMAILRSHTITVKIFPGGWNVRRPNVKRIDSDIYMLHSRFHKDGNYRPTT